MKLTERLTDGRLKKRRSPYDVLEKQASQADPPDLATVPASLKMRLHGQVIDTWDMRTVDEANPRLMRQRLQPSIEALVAADAEAADLAEDLQRRLVESILDEIVGLGPLEALLMDPDVSDILVNTYNAIYVERHGRLEKTNARFTDNAHLLNTIQRIVSRVGRRVDESSPMVDARLADGSRVNAVVPPIATDGPVLSIRRFGRRLLGPQSLVERGVATPEMMNYLAAAVGSQCNLLVSGGTGAGKTTLLNILSGFIPKHERVITIEDSAELNLQGHHVVRLEARPANIEGRGEVSIRSCVRNALRMRPDRIVIGEVRGAEVLDMLQAMNTGHEGSMGTVHANSAKDAIDRLMIMLVLSGATLSGESMAQFIVRSLRVIVQVTRFSDGARRITCITEVVGYDHQEVHAHDVFSYAPLTGRFTYHSTTLRDRFLEHGITPEQGSALWGQT